MNLKWLIYCCLSLYSLQSVNGQETRKLDILFAGDIMGHDSQIAAAKKDLSYNFDTCFSEVKHYIENADVAIANLEVTLAGPPHKGYPKFSSPDELASAIKSAGFDILLTANNHSLDRGKKGLERTIDVLDDIGIFQTGTFKNEQERKSWYPLIIEKNDIRVALLNYTYGTNGIKTEAPNIVNLIDRDEISEDLQKARNAESDFIIVTLHWGKEYQRNENTIQSELAAFMAENGADAIIGSHPHVVQPVRTIKTKDQKEVPVCFSLGNFISNQRKRYTDGGILVKLTLEKSGQNSLITGYSYLPTWVYKSAEINGENHFIILPANKSEDYYGKFSMTENEFELMSLFYKDTNEHLPNIPQLKLKVEKQDQVAD